MNRRLGKRWLALPALVLVLAGTALAAWLLTVDNAPGGGKIGSLTAPTVTAGTPLGNPLTPGNDGDGSFTIDNPNGSLIITGTSIASGDPSASGLPPYCMGNFITARALTGLSIPVPNGRTTVKIPGAFHPDSSAPPECAGQTFTKELKLTFSTP